MDLHRCMNGRMLHEPIELIVHENDRLGPELISKPREANFLKRVGRIHLRTEGPFCTSMSIMHALSALVSAS